MISEKRTETLIEMTTTVNKRHKINNECNWIQLKAINLPAIHLKSF